MLRVEQGATSSINQELFQLFQIYYTFGEKVSCGFAFFFHVSWYLPAKLNEYSLVNSSQEYEEEDHYYYNGDHENYEEESDRQRSDIDHDVFDDEEVILRVCEDSFMIQNFSSRLVTGQL